MALGQDHDPGRQAHPLADRGRVGERHDRIGDRRLLAARHAAVLAVGVLRAVADRHQHVLHGPERFDADLVGRAHQRFEGLGHREGAGVGEEESVLHGVPRGLRLRLLLRSGAPGQALTSDAREPNIRPPNAAGPARRLRPSPADSGLQQAADRAGVLRLRLLELLPAAEVSGDGAGGGAGRDRADHRLVRPLRGDLPAGDGRAGRPLRPARLPDRRRAADGGRLLRVHGRRPGGTAALSAARGAGRRLRDGLRGGRDARRRRGAPRAARPGDGRLRAHLPLDERDRSGRLRGDRAARRLARDLPGGRHPGAGQRRALAPGPRPPAARRARRARHRSASRWRCARSSCA